MLRLFARRGMTDLASLRLLEVGCGGGGNLLELLRLGFAPSTWPASSCCQSGTPSRERDCRRPCS